MQLAVMGVQMAEMTLTLMQIAVIGMCAFEEIKLFFMRIVEISKTAGMDNGNCVIFSMDTRLSIPPHHLLEIRLCLKTTLKMW